MWVVGDPGSKGRREAWKTALRTSPGVTYDERHVATAAKPCAARPVPSVDSGTPERGRGEAVLASLMTRDRGFESHPRHVPMGHDPCLAPVSVPNYLFRPTVVRAMTRASAPVSVPNYLFRPTVIRAMTCAWHRGSAPVPSSGRRFFGPWPVPGTSRVRFGLASSAPGFGRS